MLCIASAMTMLTEYDENMTSYLAVTPVGKKGYIVSRLAFPAVIAFLVSVLLMRWFSLTEWRFSMLLAICALAGFASLAAALFLFSFSHNRVEGLAMGKLAGILMFGLPVPFFMKSGVQYLFSPLPSFWIAKLSLEQNAVFLLLAVLSSLFWIWPLYREFNRKIA